MANPKFPTLQYRIITWALFPAVVAHTAYTALKHKSLAYFLQRFASYNNQTKIKTRPIWCHCASVGEINTALPLLQFLINQGESLIITTNTPTGYQTLTKAKLKNTHHFYLPLDYALLAKRYLRRFQPKQCFIFETELWPSTLLTAMRNNIHVVIVNGRISKKTLKAPAFLLKNYQRILSNTYKILSSSEENSTRFISLGANSESISTFDNLSFANTQIDENENIANPLTFPYLLCASTHEGEEEQILNAWVNHANNEIALVIAIRHPQRINQVIRTLEKSQLSFNLHSSNHESSNKDSIYIIDTLGELMPFIAHAKMVFMGGSLVPVGGHNMIEPALYKRPILIGPYHDDFKSIVNDLLSQNAIEIVQNAEQLIEKFLLYNTKKKEYLELGENAYRYIKSRQQVLNIYKSTLLTLIKS